MNRITQTALALVMAASATAALAAGEPTDPVMIDFDGTNLTQVGGTVSLDPVAVGALDWAVGSSLADGALLAGSNFVTSGGACPAGSCDFDLYTHAALAGYNNPAGDPRSINNLNGTFEWTFIFAGKEDVETFSAPSIIDTGSTAGGHIIYDFVTTASFGLTVQDNFFFEIYYDDFTTGGVQSTMLAGQGFDDGQLILSSSTLDFIQGSITTTQFSWVDLNDNALPDNGEFLAWSFLDSSPDGDNWLNQPTAGDITYSVSSVGATQLEAEVATQDSDFFKTIIGSIFSDLVFSTQNVDPFLETNPSFCYDNTAGTGGTQLCLATGDIVFADLNTITLQDGTVLSTSDYINGADIANIFGADLTGQDILFQTDANQSFRITREVPEPGIMALLGISLGLIGLNGAARRRRTTSA